MSTAASPKAEQATARGTGFAIPWPLEPNGTTPLIFSGPATEAEPLPPQRWRLLMTARLLIALALLLSQLHAWRTGYGTLTAVVLCAFLSVLSVITLALPSPRCPHAPLMSRPLSWLWLLTAWSDLVIIGVLHWLAQPGISFVPLFVWPVLLAAVVGPRPLAYGLAAAGTLVLSVDSVWRDSAGWHESDGLQAAIAGTGLLATAWLATQLVERLTRADESARNHRRLNELQHNINRIIAAELAEGIIVLDSAGNPWYANAAAERILCAPLENSAPPIVTATSDNATPVPQHNDKPLSPPGTSSAHPARIVQAAGWPVLVRWLQELQQTGIARQPGSPWIMERVFEIPVADQRCRRALARAQLLPTDWGFCIGVIVLQDMHTLEQRMRTERLATMGRLSAAVAHEIRNPLSAISQAAALLAEDTLTEAQQPLLRIIEQNAARIERTVNDVLEAVRLPTAPEAPLAIALDATVTAIVQDWLRQHPQGERLQWLPGARHAHVAFDAEHLRRVLVNLLDNADRHASAVLGAIRVETRLLGEHALLTVWSEGPEIPPTVREHLFEPFTSAHPRSSGLGLYLSRELCRRYHADLRYERSLRAQRAGNAFVVRIPLR